MNIELELKKLIKNVLNDLDLEEDIIIEIPKDRSNGDYSSNVAMKCCKKLGKSPIEIANLVKDNISSDLIESIEIKNPGFINFFVDKTYLLDNIINIIKKDKDLEHVELYEAMRNLPKSYSNVLVLYYINGLSSKEIAEIMTISEDAVNKRLSRARKKLGEELK